MAEFAIFLVVLFLILILSDDLFPGSPLLDIRDERFTSSHAHRRRPLSACNFYRVAGCLSPVTADRPHAIGSE
jgi:hypothetical protein